VGKREFEVKQRKKKQNKKNFFAQDILVGDIFFFLQSSYPLLMFKKFAS